MDSRGIEPRTTPMLREYYTTKPQAQFIAGTHDLDSRVPFHSARNSTQTETNAADPPWTSKWKLLPYRFNQESTSVDFLNSSRTPSDARRFALENSSRLANITDTKRNIRGEKLWSSRIRPITYSNCTWYKAPLRLLVLHSISSLFHPSRICCSLPLDHID
ncbi:hypothetical protein VN97_g12262 [Penicillium thymicola]|uniref:Uncharacterized protein n=1 Tax=Penicillium thymicola TaxID=293382 RepID=A0AAI9T5Q0_PENTH|nr:hypothetical protein VN97_g12262 [Penicillium thymicola]